jgi:hypothetical protein
MCKQVKWSDDWVLTQCKLNKVAEFLTDFLEVGAMLDVPYPDMEFIEQSITSSSCEHKLTRKNYALLCLWHKRLPEAERRDTRGKDKLHEALVSTGNRRAADELNKSDDDV